MNLPIILVLDDLWHWSRAERSRICQKLGLLDITSDMRRGPENADAYLAAAVFQSGQVRRGDRVDNKIEVAMTQIECGWHTDADYRWALALLDLQFDQGPVGHG